MTIYFRWNIFFFKWKNLPLLEASSVVIGNCLDSFPPIIFIYLKIFVWPFHIFESSFSLHFFSDKIRIWIKKNSDDDCLIFFGLRRVFFFTYSSSVFCYHLWCQLLFFSLLLCKRRENSNSLFLLFQFSGGKPHLLTYSTLL